MFNRMKRFCSVYMTDFIYSLYKYSIVFSQGRSQPKIILRIDRLMTQDDTNTLLSYRERKKALLTYKVWLTYLTLTSKYDVLLFVLDLNVSYRLQILFRHRNPRDSRTGSDASGFKGGCGLVFALQEDDHSNQHLTYMNLRRYGCKVKVTAMTFRMTMNVFHLATKNRVSCS